MGGVYTVLNQRRGIVVDECPIQGTPMSILKCFLPVAESFGFTASLREHTKGQAFPQCVFDHWEKSEQDPTDPESKIFKIVQDIRKRKGLKIELPPLDDYNDRL